MKKITYILVFLLTNIVLGQKINQTDANGKRHGIWKKNFDKTRVIRYEGEFFHGKEIGLFKFYKNIEGKAVLTATKEFKKNSEIAKVTYLASTGKVISKGEMNGKLRIGEWIYYHNKTKNILSKDNYNTKGELHGERLVYYPDGVLAQKEIYQNDKLHGPSLSYSTKAVLIKEYNYVNGELHGPAKVFDENALKLLEGQYQNGRKHGIWKYYNAGKFIKEKDFTRRSKNPYKK
ncbi:MAG: toxin-antitoxin system YwqK family antitoxin [Oceanihabitans sp.]